MLNKFLIASVFLFTGCFSLLAQEKNDDKKLGNPKELIIDSLAVIKEPINP